MSRQEKRRKFNEAVLNTLFPPPPLPPQPKDEDERVGILGEGFNADDLFPDDELGKFGSSTTSDDDDDDGDDDTGSQKLTRAQRKRLRIKKLKADASRRDKIIGPLLPPSNHDEGDSSVGGGILENDPPCVRRNSAEEPPTGVTSSNSANQSSKLKQRRMAKRVVKKSLKVPTIQNCHNHHQG